jgi:hypothetical protein
MTLIGSEPTSLYRKKDAARFDDFAAFRVVYDLRPFRGACTPFQVPAEKRKEYVVICGRWGKSVAYRAIPLTQAVKES